jgi:hypothetical protein
MASPIKLTKIASTLPALLLTAAAYGQVPAGDGDYAVEHLGQVEDGYQDVQTEDGFTAEPVLSSAELQELVGRVALYPDDLLAIILPASTYPLEIVQAARFLEAYENDSTLEPEEDWDESVVALLNYPEVLRILDDDIDWTWQLGDAVINQQDELIGAIEGFRDRAYAAGNLKSDEFQKITRDEGVIEIVPIEDDVIYVPYYEPEYVVTEQPQSVYHYYPEPRSVYYYPYPTGYSFSSGYFWGVTTAFRIGWASNHLRIHHPTYWGHPYYGQSYYGHYYRRPDITVYNTTYVRNSHDYGRSRYRDGDYWRPRSTAGSRQVTYTTRGGSDRNRAHTRDYRRTVNVTNASRTANVTNTSNRHTPTSREIRSQLSDGNRTRETTVRTNTTPSNGSRSRGTMLRDRDAVTSTDNSRNESGTTRQSGSTNTRRGNERRRETMATNSRNTHRSTTNTRRVIAEPMPSTNTNTVKQQSDRRQVQREQAPRQQTNQRTAPREQTARPAARRSEPTRQSRPERSSGAESGRQERASSSGSKRSERKAQDRGERGKDRKRK